MIKKAFILLFIIMTQIIQAQTKELKWEQIDIVKFGNEVTYKLKHNYDANNPDKPNQLLDGTYKIGDNYGSYAIINFKNGKAEGVWKNYNSNEKLESEGNYINSKPEGSFKEYYGDGTLHRITNYKDGKEHGKTITYDREREVKAIQNYVAGKQEGRQEGSAHIYGFNKCRYVHHYKNGKPAGLWETKCRGKVVSAKNYTSEKSYIEKQYYKNGQLEYVKSQKDGKPDGEQKVYDIDGVLLKHYIYEEGILISKKKFFETGDPKLIEHRNLDDELDGIYTVYNDIGKLVEEGQYKNDYKDGIWKNYYHNGDIMNTITYKNGKKTGKAVDYYKGNVKELVGEYFKNKKIGLWKEFTILGKLKKEYNYENGKLISEKVIID
jgi:antitoxin component YwqK of YwqJK toxin-antitoxin module